ncbi:MAG: phage capsid protein [Gammaproteobacteria bacterium]|nr:phage capsid protein [Gammaproteobacteria bacterium]
MSINLSTAAITQFDDLVKHEYQARGRLRNAVTVRNGVRGDTYRFQRMAAGTANQKATQADVTPMNVGYAVQTATLERWLAAEYTDIFDKDEVNFEEMQELAQTIAKALGRREDQLIIDAANGGTYSATPSGANQGLDIVTGAAGLTVDKLLEVNERFQDLEVADGDKHIAITAKGLRDLLTDPEVTGSDYNTVKALVSGELNTWLGMNFHVLGTRTEGGLPVVTDQRAFAWHKGAIGYAVGTIDMITKVDWVAHKTSWLTTGLLRSGAVIRENAGITRINYTT